MICFIHFLYDSQYTMFCAPRWWTPIWVGGNPNVVKKYFRLPQNVPKRVVKF